MFTMTLYNQMQRRVILALVSCVFVASCDSPDKAGLSELQQLRNAILQSESADISVEGYGNKRVRTWKGDIAQIRKAMCDAIVVSKGPWEIDGSPGFSTREEIHVGIHEGNGQMRSLTLIGGDALTFKGDKEYLAMLKDLTLERILLEASGEPSRQVAAEAAQAEMRGKK